MRATARGRKVTKFPGNFQQTKLCGIVVSMQIQKFGLATGLTLTLFACGGTDIGGGSSTDVITKFNDGLGPWKTYCSDYSLIQEAMIGFESTHELIPSALGAKKALRLRSFNVADDVWMCAYRPVNGLKPNSFYRLFMSATVLTNGGTMCFGIGGASGESVYIKAGGSTLKPSAITVGEDIRTNLDKGNQAVGSETIPVIGDFTSPGTDCTTSVPYARKVIKMPSSGRLIRTDASGTLWLVIGTDSGYEGETAIFIEEVSATLVPAG
jgi:hypothetical protein